MKSLVGYWVDFGFYSRIENHWRVLGRGVAKCHLYFNKISLTIVLNRLKGVRCGSKEKN